MPEEKDPPPQIQVSPKIWVFLILLVAFYAACCVGMWLQAPLTPGAP